MTANTAVRINTSLTAPAEKRLLVWLACRAPARITSDRLTLLGLAAQCAAGLAYALTRTNPEALLLVNLCIVLNWLGDSLDGTLARVRNQLRPRFGFYVDHMVDLFGTIALFTGLARSGLVHPYVALAMLIGFLLLAGESFLATSSLGTFQLSQGPFGPIELRLLLILANFALLHSSHAIVFGHRILWFDIAGSLGAAGMFALAINTTCRHTAQLYREEPLA